MTENILTLFKNISATTDYYNNKLPFFSIKLWPNDHKMGLFHVYF